MQPTRRTIRPASHGFSLIEILVVLTILLLLMGIAFVTMGRSIASARVSATKTTIALLDSAMQRRFEALMQNFADQERTNAKRVEWGNLAASQYYAQSLSPTPATTTSAAAQAIVKLNRYIGTFPQRWEDMYGFDGLSGSSAGGALPVPDDAWDVNAPTRKTLVAAASRYKIASSDASKNCGDAVTCGNLCDVYSASNMGCAVATDNVNENAELFFLLVTADTNGQQILDQINPRHIGDTDGDGLLEFLDDWGHPLRFYNTPTAPFALAIGGDTSVRAALFPSQSSNSPSPLDPGNALSASPYNDGSTYIVTTGITQYCHGNTYFMPLIVSCGPDESLGLVEPASSGGTDRSQLLAVPTVIDDVYDNITNFQGGN